MTDELALAWAAGLFEGEGSIILREQTSVELCVGSTDLDVLVKFSEVVECGNIREEHRRRALHHKAFFVWRVGFRHDVERVLNAFLPWLGERRTIKATEALERLLNNPGQKGTWTECKRGHPLTGDNVKLVRGGAGRQCRTCINQRRRKKDAEFRKSLVV